MAGIAETTKTFEEKKVGEEARKFAYLNTYDKAEFVRRYQKLRKEQVVENRRLAGASPEQIAVDLDAFDEDPPGDWVKWLNTEEGRVAAMEISLAKNYPGEAKALARAVDMPEAEEVDLIFKLFGKWVKRHAPQAESTSTYGDGGQDPNAQSPETYQTPAT